MAGQCLCCWCGNPSNGGRRIHHLPFHTVALGNLHSHSAGFCSTDSLCLLQKLGETKYRRAAADGMTRAA